MPSRESQQMQALLRMQIAPLFKGGTSVETLRGFWEAMSAQMSSPPGTAVEKVTALATPSEWVSAPGADAERVILYLHGGAYCIGSLNTHRGLAGYLSSATGARVLLIEYRLAPEHPFPAALEDATASYRWLVKSGVDPKRIIIAGDSAGGGLTLATLVSLRDAGDPLPAGAVLLSPWTDLAATGASYETRAKVDPVLSKTSLPETVLWYIGDRDPKAPLASPLYAELRGLPPLLIHVGDHEVLLDDSIGVAERARAAGVDVTLEVWEEMWHVFHQTVPQVPEAREAIEKIGAYVRALLR
jgi:epsilon-lactone hydrolase